MASPVHLLQPSVAGKEYAVAVEAVSDAVSAQRKSATGIWISSGRQT